MTERIYLIATDSKKDGKEIYLADRNRNPIGVYWTENPYLAYHYMGKIGKDRAELKCMTLFFNNPRVITFEKALKEHLQIDDILV